VKASTSSSDRRQHSGLVVSPCARMVRSNSSTARAGGSWPSRWRSSSTGTNGAIHPEDLRRLIEDFTRAIASGHPFEWEVRGRRFDGSTLVSVSRISASGRQRCIVRWYNLLVDVDERTCRGGAQRAYDSFADAQRLSKRAASITDLVGDDHNWSEETYRIFEFELGRKSRCREFKRSSTRMTAVGFGIHDRARNVRWKTSIFRFDCNRARCREACTRDRPCHREDRGSTDVRRRPAGVTESMVAEEALNRPARSSLMGASRDPEHVTASIT